ncbi:uncharacterized protein LOC131931320 [Physella acuta]|uniref:uncharacterized protein LOC131931320 n=1 Tax=Physella acuta TaxID=109671 RepID=UPI0027DC30FA|nr:uncharacterized protein LOC131931320 [Physella acuta]
MSKSVGPIKLPSLTSKYTQFIRPRQLTDDEPPLKLTIVHGRRQFKICLKIADNENGDRISMRHLAEMISCETGIPPRDQKFYYKDVSWQNPDMGPWSPALRDLGIKNGDKIHLVAFHAPFPDYTDLSTLDDTEKKINGLVKELRCLFYTLHGVHEGYKEGNNQLMALNRLKQGFEKVKTSLMSEIQVLNNLHFDHRNMFGQARRRQIVDSTQRQIDKCTDAATAIFHKLAQAHYIANVGRIYPREYRLTASANRFC